MASRTQNGNVHPSVPDTGIFPLWTSSDPTLDIVAVHGIGADPYWTWVEKKTKINWLNHEAMLPAEAPKSRILCFGYKSQWLPGQHYYKTSLRTVSDQLIQHLAEARKECQKRPILFIGHCFGGLVIEQAILDSQHLKEYTTGVMFFGTPHKGSSSHKKADIVATIAAVCGLGDRKDLLNVIKQDQSFSIEFERIFANNCNSNNIKLHCFWEQGKTDVSAVVRPKFVPSSYKYEEHIVTRFSGCLGVGTETGLHKDHFTLNKFTLKKFGGEYDDDKIWDLVRGQVSEFTTHAVSRIRHPFDPHINMLIRRHGTSEILSKLWKQQPQCLEGTREEILEDIRKWINGPNGKQIYWLQGMSGTGKSTVARTVADEVDKMKMKRSLVVAKFEFIKNDADLGHLQNLVPVVAYQFAGHDSFRGTISHLVAENDYKILGDGTMQQWEVLVEKPVRELQKCPPILLFIDALDVCNKKDIQTMISLLKAATRLPKDRFRIFLTSTPEVYGTRGLDEGLEDAIEKHELEKNHEDISRMIRKNLQEIRQPREGFGTDDRIPSNWPSEEQIQVLTVRSEGLFVYASTVCHIVEHAEDPQQILCDLINRERSSDSFSSIDDIYKYVLKRDTGDLPPDLKNKTGQRFRHVIGTVVVLFDQFPIQSLAAFARETQQQAYVTLHRLRSIIHVDEQSPVRLYHSTLRYYLMDKEECPSPFLIDEIEAHRHVWKGCLEVIKDAIEDGIVSGTTSTLKRLPSSMRQNFTPHFIYACKYWVEHLRKSKDKLTDKDVVHGFLEEYLLHWIEALGWMAEVSVGVHAIVTLEMMITANDCPELWAFIHDAKRFIVYNRPGIEEFPPHVKEGALLFAPTTSVVKRHFEQVQALAHQIRRLPRREEKWESLVQTVSVDEEPVYSMRFSGDGKNLMLVSKGGIIDRLDSVSGTLQRTIQIEDVSAYYWAFSPGGGYLASVLPDHTIKLWNPSTGSPLGTLQGSPGPVEQITFSADGQMLASLSEGNRIVHVWNVDRPAPQQILAPHPADIWSIVLSPDGKTLASIVGRRGILLWDSVSGALLPSLPAQSDHLNSSRFSADGRYLVSTCSEKFIRIWNIDSRTMETIHVPDFAMAAMAMSIDGQQLATASERDEIYLWDFPSRTIKQVLGGHSSRVSSLEFSADGKTLASLSKDDTIKFWDTTADQEGTPQTEDATVSLWDPFSYDPDPVNAISFSVNGKYLGSCSSHAVQFWHPATGKQLCAFEAHSDRVNCVVFSPDEQNLASASNDKTVKLWALSTVFAGKKSKRRMRPLYTLDRHSSWVGAVAFTKDGSLLASASNDHTVKLWNPTSGQLLWDIIDPLERSRALHSTATGHMTSNSHNNATNRKKPTSETQSREKEGHSGSVLSLAFAETGRMASASLDETIKIWDPVRPDKLELFQTLQNQGLKISFVNDMVFSADGRMLASLDELFSAEDRRLPSFEQEIKVWNVDTGELIKILDEKSIPLSRSLRQNIMISASPGVFIRGHNLFYNGEDRLWIPSEWKSDKVAIQGNKVAFGYASGRIVILEVQ